MESNATNPKLGYMTSEFDTHFKVFHELMSNKVLEILLVASAYDAYILEEDGSLASKIINEYRGLNLSRPPRLIRVDGAQRALEMVAKEKFDLVLTMPHLDDMDPFDLGLAIKKIAPELPVILLAHSIQGLFPLPAGKNNAGIDQIFIWSGDADLLLAIVKSVEDSRNVEMDTKKAQVRVLILVEDSPLYRSYFLPLIYKEVVHQTQEVLDESLNEEHRLLKMRARPKILIAETYETAVALYERYKPFLFGIMSDTRFPRDGRLSADAGVQFLKTIKDEIPDLPLLLLSNEIHNRAKAEQIPAQFLDKNSVHLFSELHEFFLDYLGFGDFIFRDVNGNEVARASNLRHLETILPDIPEEPLCYHASRNRFSNWIMARSEIALASHLRQLAVSDFPDMASVRQYLISSIHELRKWRQKGVVTQFNPKEFDPHVTDLVKIGNGSLGGKARGIAFAANLLRQSKSLFGKYQGIKIGIPSTLVITTDGFDAFIEANGLQVPHHGEMNDGQIAEAFDAARMPEDLTQSLRVFLEAVDYPLSVRSSSLLEDAHQQPLAGLYKTFMIANNHADVEVRLEQLVSAVKQVYASTWFEHPRQFARNTTYRHRKEQMAVMIQRASGRQYGDYFYPALSGVARSQNFYPIQQIRPDDGMAKIALGFGKIISSGEGGLRFCPKYPSLMPDFSKIEDILANAQRHFFALSMTDTGTVFDLNADLHRRAVNDALNEPPLMGVVSTYLPEDGRIRDSVSAKGPKLVTFASILKYNHIPMAEMLTDLLTIGRQGLGCHVEIEFAVDLATGQQKPPEFYILQMRPMAGGGPFDVEIAADDRDQAVCYSSQALGHGRFDHVADIVYVKPDDFDAACTREIATEVGRINAVLKAEQRPYLLIGPGRWGSFDPWLGIPVKWENIDGAGAIIELRNLSLKADPSHGSHFFQHITTHGLPYLTITEEGDDLIRWNRIQKFNHLQHTTYLSHVRLRDSLLIKCDGRSSQCAILVP